MRPSLLRHFLLPSLGLFLAIVGAIHPLEFFFLLSCFHTRRRLLRKRRCGGWPAWPLPRPPSVAGAAERQTDGRGRTSGSSPLPVLALCPFLELLLSSSVSQPKIFSLPLSLHGLYPDPDAAKSQGILRSTPDLNQVRRSTPESILHSTLASVTRSTSSLQLLFHHTPATSYCCGVALRGAVPFARSRARGLWSCGRAPVCVRPPPATATLGSLGDSPAFGGRSARCSYSPFVRALTITMPSRK